ncbi:glycosyltransferase [Alkaliphilus serpentinus]|uniref:Glycosyltransferase family 1 protein n=1 Tax=Alkaliphilus serpentinus TaxID=1482731 RepID=A0A833HLK1_9FIRM|nr:glycosyltransferase [Alkaliphilus serpentinus]KAB3525939.1 glycosyltransferase family 1 protein [Alkaliphilus serpentinus]
MITILCAGSRGDFQPYIALAQQLIKQGKNVRIAGPDNFKGFIEGYNINFYPINVNMDELDIDPKLLEDAGSSDNPLKMLLTFNKMKRYGLYTNTGYYKACKDSELIIYHPGCTIGYFAAQQLNIPAVLASPFPIHRTNEYLSVVMYGKSKPSTFKKKLSYKLIQGMLWMAGKNSVKTFWKKEFGQLPKNFGAPYELHNNPKNPAIISCSNQIFNRPSDWNPHIHQKGYWFVEEAHDYTPDQTLVDFLNTGEKPIYIGFGSMSMIKKHKTLKETIIEGIKKSGRRAVILGFGHPDNLPDNIYALDSVPHTWLFKHVSAVCHHGGAGTSAAGFSAGVPSIIVPFSNDQFAWAHRSYDLGIGVKPIYINDLNSDNLSQTIIDAHEPTLIAKAKSVGSAIQLENGAKECADIIVHLLEN